MSIKINRQNPSSGGGQQPSDLLYGEIACDKDGTLYVGNSSNVPTYMLNSDIYNQVGNPNLLDNSDFTNPVNQRNKTEFDINGYCIDRWQIFESTYNVNTRVVKSDSTVGESGSQFRQIVNTDLLTIGDIVTVSAYVNNTKHSFTKTIQSSTWGSIKDAPYDLETSWGGFKLVKLRHRTEIFFVMYLKPSQSITVNWAKLERGSSVTPYVPKGYGAELAECLRYFQRVHTDWRIYPTLKDMLYRFSQSTLQVMRIKPTISAHGTPYTFGCTINALDAQPMAFTVETKITEQGQNAAAASMLGPFDLSADL